MYLEMYLEMWIVKLFVWLDVFYTCTDNVKINIFIPINFTL